MLAGCWLLADLDGTLLSTPHKAHGRYVSLAHSPCFTPLRRWLHNGGSLCVVTTADTRALAQVYVPLREYLTTKTRAAATCDAPSLSTSKTTPCSGELLLCLYTGAVLYRCTANGVSLVPTYTRSLHCATRESVELAARHRVAASLPRAHVAVGNSPRDGKDENKSSSSSNCQSVSTTTVEERVCVRGTCIDARTSRTLLDHLVDVYVSYVHDVLRGEAAVLRAQSQLSRRYRDMWQCLLMLLDTLYACAEHDEASDSATSSSPPPAASSCARSDAAVAWQLHYIRTHRDLFVALGIIRVECVEARVCADDIVAAVAAPGTSHDGKSSGGSHDKATAAAVASTTPTAISAAAQHAVSVLSRDVPAARRGGARATDVVRSACVQLTALLGTPPPSSHNDDDGNRSAVAQLIVLGVPLALFGRYFASSVATFVRVGVQALPQPNSVVFCKLGVSKSTALRYLLGKDRVVASSNNNNNNNSNNNNSSPMTAAAARDDCLAASVRTGRCVALGDNPQSTDYELTVFADVPFVSVETTAQRVERHRRIARRLARTRAAELRGVQPTMPDGSAAPSYAELCARRWRSGVLMDDTLPSHLLYVGGEEEGTAAFLDALMHYLHVPALPGCTHTDAHTAALPPATTLSGDTVTASAFCEAVYAAQHTARHVVARQTVQPSKL